MSTLNLIIPLTIPQLAELVKAQFSPAERAELAERILEPKTKKPQKELPSIKHDLQEAFLELKQARQSGKQLQTLDDFLNEL